MEPFRNALEEAASRYAASQPHAKDNKLEYEKEKAAFKDGAAWARWFLYENEENEKTADNRQTIIYKANPSIQITAPEIIYRPALKGPGCYTIPAPAIIFKEISVKAEQWEKVTPERAAMLSTEQYRKTIRLKDDPFVQISAPVDYWTEEPDRWTIHTKLVKGFNSYCKQIWTAEE